MVNEVDDVASLSSFVLFSIGPIFKSNYLLLYVLTMPVFMDSKF